MSKRKIFRYFIPPGVDLRVIVEMTWRLFIFYLSFQTHASNIRFEKREQTCVRHNQVCNCHTIETLMQTVFFFCYFNAVKRWSFISASSRAELNGSWKNKDGNFEPARSRIISSLSYSRLLPNCTIQEHKKIAVKTIRNRGFYFNICRGYRVSNILHLFG